jgi:hypothetical protein
MTNMCSTCKEAGSLLRLNVKDDGSVTDNARKAINALHDACKFIRGCTCQHKIGKFITREDEE